MRRILQHLLQTLHRVFLLHHRCERLLQSLLTSQIIMEERLKIFCMRHHRVQLCFQFQTKFFVFFNSCNKRLGYLNNCISLGSVTFEVGSCVTLIFKTIFFAGIDQKQNNNIMRSLAQWCFINYKHMTILVTLKKFLFLLILKENSLIGVIAYSTTINI